MFFVLRSISWIGTALREFGLHYLLCGMTFYETGKRVLASRCLYVEGHVETVTFRKQPTISAYRQLSRAR